METFIIGQSGGPTSMINATLAGCIKALKKHFPKSLILGAHYGIKGLIDNDFIDLNDIDIEKLSLTPSAFLGSVRYNLKKESDFEKIADTFNKYSVKAFIYIGGNDSMLTLKNLADYVKNKDLNTLIIGLPKTIDNDLAVTHFSPGYPSSAKFIINALHNIYYDCTCYETGKVNIVEIMGRDAGWLTASTILCNEKEKEVDLICLPEVVFDVDVFLNKVKDIYAKKHSCLIAVSEGIKDSEGTYILKKRSFLPSDDFGHLQLGGVALILAEIVTNNLNLPTRAIELNTLQRCFMQEASLQDYNTSLQLGNALIKLIENNESGKMIYIKEDLCFGATDLENVGGIIKKIPDAWISNGKPNEEFINYLKPLVKGRVIVEEKGILSDYFKKESA